MTVAMEEGAATAAGADEVLVDCFAHASALIASSAVAADLIAASHTARFQIATFHLRTSERDGVTTRREGRKSAVPSRDLATEVLGARVVTR
jgi:hypothetical protein